VTELGPAESASTRGNAIDVEQAVRSRYSSAAAAREAELCCPVQYDNQYLDPLPQELIERDYGCGDPTPHLQAGETVLDLGSGGGKIGYIAAQVVGAAGRVIGVDVNDEMLALARRYQQEIGDRLGYHNTEFRKGKIQDLALDLDQFEEHLAAQPVKTSADWLRAAGHADTLRRQSPMIADDTVDVVVSNCVLNLVRLEDRQQLFREIHRVLKRGGRAVISDIVSDRPVPAALRNDPQLWSGCISGAFVETELPGAFEQAGFYGVEILSRQAEPWAVVEGIEFRSVTLRAYKARDGLSQDRNEAVIYRGPWKSVTDDDGHVLRRGTPMAVCGTRFEIYNRPPYSKDIIAVPPQLHSSPEKASQYDGHPGAARPAQQTEGQHDELTQLPQDDGCGPECCEA